MTRRHILILDDDEERHTWFRRRFLAEVPPLTEPPIVVHTYGYHHCVELLAERRWDLVHLDHDLHLSRPGDQRGPYGGFYDGRDVAMVIAGMPPERRPLRAIVHSWNEVRGPEMVQILRRVGVEVSLEPWRRRA